VISDVNVHKTNSFLDQSIRFWTYFSIRFDIEKKLLFYSYLAVIESKIRLISFKKSKEITKTIKKLTTVTKD
jgi:hypothetical protein